MALVLGLHRQARRVASADHLPLGRRNSEAKLSQILSGGKKVSSAVIFKEVGLARPRFTAFIKANAGVLHIEGNKRSTLYSLKG
jgi:hypothetical protein